MLNFTFIIFFIFKGVTFELADGIEISMWEAMTNKTMHILLSQVNVDLPYDYHWYNDWLIYFFMIVGVILSITFIKAIYQGVREKKKEVVEKERVSEQKKTNDILTKTIEKIFKD